MCSHGIPLRLFMSSLISSVSIASAFRIVSLLSP